MDVTGERWTITRDGEAAAKALACKQYPNKARVEELHHITPQYLRGAADGPTVPLDAAYHQQITNAFRRVAPYGEDYDSLSPEDLQQFMNDVYSKYPLPPGTQQP